MATVRASNGVEVEFTQAVRLRGLVAHLRAWGPAGEYATAMQDAADMLEAMLP